MKWLKRSAGILVLVSASAFVLQAIPFFMAGMSVNNLKETSAIGIIGSVDGPTSIFVAARIAPYYKITASLAIVFFIVWLILRAKSKKR